MAIRCPQCSYDNPDQSGFCVRCGNRLSSASTGYNPSPSSSGYQGLQSQVGAGSSSPPATPPPSFQAATSSPLPQMGSTQSGNIQEQTSLRRAFAGHGVSVSHQSWLLNGDQAHARDVFSTILAILRQRTIVGLNVNSERLTERGIQSEEREYLTVQRGVTTVFIYVAPAGQDLYISRATAVLPAIDIFRVVIMGAWIVIALFGSPIIQTLIPGIAGMLLASFLTSITFLFFWVPFIVFAIRSIRHWLIEKDLWAYLRSTELNDFQLDDIMLLEHVTDDTVLDAVKQLGLDASKIVPPPQGYQPKRRVRAI